MEASFFLRKRRLKKKARGQNEDFFFASRENDSICEKRERKKRGTQNPFSPFFHFFCMKSFLKESFRFCHAIFPEKKCSRYLHIFRTFLNEYQKCIRKGVENWKVT